MSNRPTVRESIDSYQAKLGENIEDPDSLVDIGASTLGIEIQAIGDDLVYASNRKTAKIQGYFNSKPERTNTVTFLSDSYALLVRQWISRDEYETVLQKQSTYKIKNSTRYLNALLQTQELNADEEDLLVEMFVMNETDLAKRRIIINIADDVDPKLGYKPLKFTLTTRESAWAHIGLEDQEL